MVTFGPATPGASFTSFSASFSSLKPAGTCPFLRADMSPCIVLIEERKTLAGGLVGEGVTDGIGFELITGAGAEGIGEDTGPEGAGGGTTGLIGGGDFISLTGKFGGILISGVRGLAVPSIAFSGGRGPLDFGGVIPLGAGRFGLTGDGEGGGVVDPETGGLISSILMQATPICE